MAAGGRASGPGIKLRPCSTGAESRTLLFAGAADGNQCCSAWDGAGAHPSPTCQVPGGFEKPLAGGSLVPVDPVQHCTVPAAWVLLQDCVLVSSAVPL